MSYSKRQLYALGEPLGDSVTRNNVGGGRIYGGGGGGGGSPPPAASPTQTTVQNTNIPEYAQPYVENMLNAAQAQIYTPDMTGFNPYTPYSNKPSDYVAGFSPLQQQAQSSAANMKTSAGLPAYQGLSALSGLNYASQATNPEATQAYMSPYMQNVVDVQKAQAQRDAQKGLVAQNMAAARQGTYGGARNALMQSEADRNLQTQLGQIQATGQQNAFQNAQQTQQFGANLGMQGYNQAANIAGQQLAQEQSIANLQNQMGGQQQANQQNVINQAVQNYATAQQYPYLQLGMLNSMLRGLPMQQASTQMYQAAPSSVSQLAGLGTAGLGAAAMYNASKGAKGGLGSDIAKFDSGGAVPMKSYSDQQLLKVQKDPRSKPLDKLYAQGLMDNHNYLRGNPEAAKQISQFQQPAQPEPQQMAGLGNAPTGDVIPRTFASGGIMSFADEGEVPPAKNPVDDALAMYADKSGKVDLNKAALALLGQAQSGKEATKDERAAIEKSLKEQHDMGGARALTRFGLNLAAQPGQYLGQNVAAAGLNTLNTYEKEVAAERELKRQLAKLDAEGAAKDDARRLQLAGTLLQIQGQRDMKMAALANAPSQEDRAINRAQTLVNNDPTIKALTKQQAASGAQPGTPEYDYYEQRIAERQMQIFTTAGVKVPEVTPTKIQYPKQEEKPGFFSSLFGGGKSETAQPKVVPFNQLPT
jgi:hypothetical protein